MKYISGLIIAVALTSTSSIVVAEVKKAETQNFSDIRADILTTITSINELRLMMINNDLKNNKNSGSSKNVKKLVSNVKTNNRTLKELTNEAKSNSIRLAILEKRTFSKGDNDFNEYVTRTTKKVFKIQQVQTRRSEIDCEAVTDTYNYSRVMNSNDVTDITETITRHDVTGRVCFKRKVHKRKTQTELLYVSNQNKIYNDLPVNDFVTYTDPVIVLTSSMEKGKAFGSGGVINYASNGTSNTLVYNKVSTMLNADAEITLTINDAEKTYLNCLIIGTRSNSTVSTEWYCPGDGLVKRIIFFPGVGEKPSRSEIVTLKTIAAY